MHSIARQKRTISEADIRLMTASVSTAHHIKAPILPNRLLLVRRKGQLRDACLRRSIRGLSVIHLVVVS